MSNFRNTMASTCNDLNIALDQAVRRRELVARKHGPWCAEWDIAWVTCRAVEELRDRYRNMLASAFRNDMDPQILVAAGFPGWPGVAA